MYIQFQKLQLLSIATPVLFLVVLRDKMDSPLHSVKNNNEKKIYNKNRFYFIDNQNLVLLKFNVVD